MLERILAILVEVYVWGDDHPNNRAFALGCGGLVVLLLGAGFCLMAH